MVVTYKHKLMPRLGFRQRMKITRGGQTSSGRQCDLDIRDHDPSWAAFESAASNRRLCFLGDRPTVNKSPLSPSPRRCRNQKIQPTHGRPGTRLASKRAAAAAGSEAESTRLGLMDGRTQTVAGACMSRERLPQPQNCVDSLKRVHLEKGNTELHHFSIK